MKPSPQLVYKPCGSALRRDVTPAQIIPRYDSLSPPHSLLFSSLFALTNLHDSVGRSTPAKFSRLSSRQVQLQKPLFSHLIRNGSNFAQHLRQRTVHDTCARKSQVPQPHRIDSGTVSLLRLHGNARNNAIDVKLGNVIQ
jgi:hypothetical protein